MLGKGKMLELPIKNDLLYLMRFVDDYIEELVNRVLCDSSEDPHWSAITAENLILCYINVIKWTGENLEFHDVKSYFKSNCFSSLEYEMFEKKCQEEAKYYIGKTKRDRDKGTVCVNPNEKLR